jgi:uncharacterized membrane protein YkvA (DUF1232 family)
MPNFIDKIKQKARELKKEVYVLYFAFRDKRTPCYAKAFSALVLAYAFSPIDLIPDFVPVLGYLDDLVIIPAGIAVALRMIPEKVMADARISSENHNRGSKPLGWAGAVFIILIWAAVLFLIYRLVVNSSQIHK